MSTRHKHADVIIAWAEGKDVQARAPLAREWSDLSLVTPNFHEEWEYRIKPPAKKYRVALFRKYDEAPLVVAITSQSCADSFESMSDFVRWLTSWPLLARAVRIVSSPCRTSSVGSPIG